MKITVFTPTFNRSYIIDRLYNSLLKQTFKDFEWIIVDDGSTDITEELVSKFINENKINIRYLKQKNQGKHIAINSATEIANGELFFIVDSDDILPEDSLEIIANTWNTVSDDKIIGIGGRKKNINTISKRFNFEEDYMDLDAITFNLVYKNIQDKAEVFKTEVLRSYKFPQIEDEKFITEAVVWYRMAADGYSLRWINKDIYVCEYLDDGLTNNSVRHRLNSINGTILSYNLLASYPIPFNYKIRYKINFCRFARNKYKGYFKLKDIAKEKNYLLVAYILSYPLYLKDKLSIKHR